MPVLVIMSLIVWLEAITFIILYVLHSLQVMQENTNKHDESTVGIAKEVCIIGHIPIEILRIFSFILRHGTIIRLLNLTTLVAGI